MRIAIVSSDTEKKWLVWEQLDSKLTLPFLDENILPITFWRDPFKILYKNHSTGEYITIFSLYDMYVDTYSFVTFSLSWMKILSKRPYTHVFYIPINKYIVEGDVINNPENTTLMLQDVELKTTLDFFHVPYNTLEGTVDEMVEQILFVLGCKKDTPLNMETENDNK